MSSYVRLNDNTFTDQLNVIVSKEAAAHNAVYRGKNIQDKFNNGSLYTAINNGTFDDLYIGDFFDFSMSSSYGTETVRGVLADFDTFYNNGDTSLTRHHASVIPLNCFKNTQRMNSSHVTTGGFKGSEMNQTTLPKYASALSNVFGSHLLNRRTLVSNSVNTSIASMAGAGWQGASNNWEWMDTKLTLMSEIQVYGANVLSSSFFDTGEANHQLAIFQLNPAMKVATLGYLSTNRQWYWLRCVAGSGAFCHVSRDGSSGYSGAGDSSGVRPLWIIG